jgi:hypothetical protein
VDNNRTHLGGFILMTSFSNSSTISLLRDPQAIIVPEGSLSCTRQERREKTEADKGEETGAL